MSGADEEWVQAAMSDDAMVVELLVRLHHAPPPPSLFKRLPFPMDWSVRQRRSKSGSANKNAKESSRSHRGSPTTPLSWSSADSFSGGSAGAGGFVSFSKESTRPTPVKHSSTSRCQANLASEKTNSKRPRKKKTLAELKIEESLLLRERRDMKREMATLCLYLETQRAANGNLKRLKIELQNHLEKQSCQLQPDVASSHIPVASGIAQKTSASKSSARPEAETDAKFVLPDLNVPFDDPGRDDI